MRHLRLLISAAVVGALATSAVAMRTQVTGPDKAELALRAAMEKESVAGDLKAAIEQYRTVAATYARSNRAVAARALFRLAGCYEKLGREEAGKTYQQLLSEYADQTDVAAQARTRLSALAKSGASEQPQGISVRRVSLGSGSGISPDGRYLVFTDWDTGDLAVRDLNTGRIWRLTNKGPWEKSDEFAECAVFSPDGKQIVYEWFSKDSSYDLRIVGLDGSGDRLLLKGMFRNNKADYFEPLQWSSDGKRILAALYRDWPAGELALVSVADGTVRVIKSTSWRAGPGNSTAQASLSPDGRYVVYDQAATEGANQRDIFLLAVDGSRDSLLVQDPADDRKPVWTPDGKHLIFASDRAGSMGFWSIGVADGKPQGVPKLVKADVSRWSGTIIGFTRDGSLFYSVSSGMQDVYIAELDPATGKVVRQPRRAPPRFAGTNTGPAWSPDGQYLAYDSLRGRDRLTPGALVTVILDTRTGEDREIRTKLVRRSPTCWFPDGQSLLYPAHLGPVPSRDTVYYRLDIRTGQVTLLRQSTSGVDLDYPTLSPDGKTLYFNHLENKDSEVSRSSLMAYEIESGRVREVLAAGGGAHPVKAVSPDNKELAFVEGDAAWIIPADGGKPRELVRPNPNRFLSWSPGGIAWSPDGQYLYMAECEGDRNTPTIGKCELIRVQAKSGEAQRLGITMEGIQPLSVNPDGRRIAFGSGRPIESSSETWVMENFLSLLEREN
jgi:Tol biopolymer transport system component